MLTLDLGISQIHHQPVREDEVKGTLRKINGSDIRALKLNVLEDSAVDSLVFLDEGLHEFNSNQVACALGELAGKSSNSCAQLKHLRTKATYSSIYWNEFWDYERTRFPLKTGKSSRTSGSSAL